MDYSGFFEGSSYYNVNVVTEDGFTSTHFTPNACGYGEFQLADWTGNCQIELIHILSQYIQDPY